MKTKVLIRVSLLVALIAIGGKIVIPVPIVGYFTLQLTFVLLAGILLGKRNGAIAASIYCFGGLLGIPWFAAGGGISYVLRPTFGFIVAFIFASYLVGYFRERSASMASLIFGAVIATIMVWVLGVIYLWGINTLYLGTSIAFIPLVLSIFSVSFYADLLLTIPVALVGKRVIKIFGE